MTIGAPGNRRARRLAWVAIALAGLSFVATVIGQGYGGHPRWWAWGIPFLIAANAAVNAFGVLRPWPRLNRWFPFLSIALSIAIVVAIILSK